MVCRKFHRGNLCSPEAWNNVYVWIDWNRPTDRGTYVPIDTARCKVACPRLKREINPSKWAFEKRLLNSYFYEQQCKPFFHMPQHMSKSGSWTIFIQGRMRTSFYDMTVWKPIQGKNDITLVFLQFCRFHTCTIQEQSRVKSFLERFLKIKNRFFIYRKGGGNTDSCELYWLIFWFHIVILCKISFHLIGHTIWFNTERVFIFWATVTFL